MDKKALAKFSNFFIRTDIPNQQFVAICSHGHKQFTCEFSAQYLNNSSTGYASKLYFSHCRKIFKSWPRFANFPENFRDSTDTKMVLKPNFQFNIYIFRALTDLRSLLQSLKQNCRKSAQVCKIEKQPSFTEIQFQYMLRVTN